MPQRRRAVEQKLSAEEVSSLPLNERDFSKLLLLYAGTMTDTNGAANFTQQFSVNGQRGVASVFAMDGADTSDPEMGGATFSNFNVDAIPRKCNRVRGHAGGNRAWCSGIHERGDKIGNGAGARAVFLSLCAMPHSTRAITLITPAMSIRGGSAICAQRIWLHQWRPGSDSGNLRRPRQNVLLRGIPGLSPSPGHNTGIRGANGGGKTRD